MVELAQMSDREAFEEQLYRPPHVARLTERAGRFVDKLDNADRTALLALAIDALFNMRAKISTNQDLLRVWDEALRQAALSRPRWRVARCAWGIAVEWTWVRSSKLGRTA